MVTCVDSYEYYLQFHQNKSQFIDQINVENQQILIAVQKLLANKKLNENDVALVFDKTIEMILADTGGSTLILDEILELSLTADGLLLSKVLLTQDCDIQKLRVLGKFINFALLDLQSIDGFLREAEYFLTENVFREGPAHPYIVSLLKTLVSSKLGERVMNSIYERCIERKDRLGLQNMCYFFDKMCDNSIFDVNHLRHLIKYFESSDNQMACKQGVFLVKILIEKGVLRDEANWKAFTVIMESLDESSHISLPTLELLASMEVTSEFEAFWFVICKRVLAHQAGVVRNWGLNYILNRECQFSDEQVITILDSLNYTSLFDSQEHQLLSSIKTFIKGNFSAIFNALSQINWLTVPFFHVLKDISCHIEATRPTLTSEQLKSLYNQTLVLPKKIKNVTFRPAIQQLYSQLLYVVMQTASLADVLKIIINVFEISDNSECLDPCLQFVRHEDYELIFTDDTSYEFLKYALVRLHINKSVKEIKFAARKLTQRKKLTMEAVCALNKFADGFEDFPDELMHETIDDMWINIADNKLENLMGDIDVLEIGLNATACDIERGRVDHFIEMLSKIDAIREAKPEFGQAYDRILGIVLRYRKKRDVAFLNTANPAHTNLTTLFIDCKNSFDDDHPPIFYEGLISDAEDLLDKISLEEEYLKIFDIMEMICMKAQHFILTDGSMRRKFLNFFSQFITAFNNHDTISVDFWMKTIVMLFKVTKNESTSTDWIIGIENVFESIFTQFTPSDKHHVLLAILKTATSTSCMRSSNQLADFLRKRLVERIFEIDVMTRDQQIEYRLMNKIDKLANEKLRLRLDAAKYLHDEFYENFTSMIREEVLNLSKISRKKPRYYSNSNVHRLKLHHYQVLLFCDTIDNDLMNALVYELLWISNQLNIQYIIEIIISRHHPNFLVLLDDESQKTDLKPQALKSIFSIAIMQIKAQTDFEVAEKMLDDIYKKVFPFSMGQNFGVRVYSLLAMVLSFEHVRSMRNFKNTTIVSKIEELCVVINESVKQKNSLKYFNALKQDFRFVRPLSDLMTISFFYHQIPAATNMPFEEIIIVDERLEPLIIADMLKFSDVIVVSDELELTVETQSRDGKINLQQKYVPFKYQIPGDNLISSLPKVPMSRLCDSGQESQNYELIVVASLVNKNANLGGLARTCEIFGASNFVIDSLKSVENNDFKSLSKTAEKWIKISEVKHWQLFEYLIAMKQYGYKIVGAEQSVHSVSLSRAEFPRKCVLLLGNERSGVPADLLSLMDIIIEVPQCGVIRSLNVHVTGAILIWEYAKKFNLVTK